MEDILLLHGAIGSKAQLLPLSAELEDQYRVHALDLCGHGGETFPLMPFSIPLFAEQVLTYLEQHKLEKVHVFGYSMGGYIAMYLAKQQPQKIMKLITLATKFHWDKDVAEKEVKMLDPELIEQKIPAFAEQLKERHAPADWKKLLEKTRELLLQLGRQNTLQPGDYMGIATPSLLLLGDRDKMITQEETTAVYRQLPFAEFGILPGTPHPIEQVDMDMLAFLIKRFLRKPKA